MIWGEIVFSASGRVKQYWDCKLITENISQKSINLRTWYEILMKCDCSDGSILKTIKEPKFVSLKIIEQPRFLHFFEQESKNYKHWKGLYWKIWQFSYSEYELKKVDIKGKKYFLFFQKIKKHFVFLFFKYCSMRKKELNICELVEVNALILQYLKQTQTQLVKFYYLEIKEGQ